VYANKPGQTLLDVSYGRMLLTFGSALAFFDGLFYAIGELGLRMAGSSVGAMTVLGRYLAPHTNNPEAQVVIDALRNNEVYLENQLLAVQEILLAAHDQYVFWIWKVCLVGICSLAALLYVVQNLLEWWQGREIPRRCDSRMGILYDGVFVPCPLPSPKLVAVPFLPTRSERWFGALRLTARRPRPAWVSTVHPMSPLAVALLERYIAYPAWPADVPETNGKPSRHHGTASLAQHAVGVRQRCLELAVRANLPPALVEQVALAHDLGKLATFRPEHDTWIRVFRHHDRMSSQILTALPGWQTLPPEEREDLRIAVRFHHNASAIPLDASNRARALLSILAQAHKQTALWETDAAGNPPRGGTAPPLAAPAASIPARAAAGPASMATGVSAAAGTATAPSASPDVPPAPIAVVTTPVAQGSPPAASSVPDLAGPTETAEPSADPVAGAEEAHPEAAEPDATAHDPNTTVVPVQPAMVDRLCEALVTVMPHLKVNATPPFDGLTIPETDLVMVLDHGLRHLLCGALTPGECAQLRMSAKEINSSTGSMVPVPHASAANLAAALRRMGWLVEEHGGQVGTLWAVEVGRRDWLACWVIRRSLIPVEAMQRWPSMPRFAPKISKPSWVDTRAPSPAAAEETTAEEPDGGAEESGPEAAGPDDG